MQIQLTTESESLPGTSGLALGGSVGESDTELQVHEVLFPPLVNCNDRPTFTVEEVKLISNELWDQFKFEGGRL